MLLEAAERVYGLIQASARCLADKLAPGKIRHTLADLIGQPVFGIACVTPGVDHLGYGERRAPAPPAPTAPMGTALVCQADESAVSRDGLAVAVNFDAPTVDHTGRALTAVCSPPPGSLFEVARTRLRAGDRTTRMRGARSRAP